MQVVFCSSEVFPFAKTGGLADVCGSLPMALERKSLDVTVFMPYYRGVDRSGYEIRQVTDGLFQTQIGQAVHVYFVENKKYFERKHLYGDSHGDYSDNLERYKFFCEKTLDYLKELQISPDIVHCHDWQASLIPVLLEERLKENPFFSSMKTLLTIHNLAFQGIFPSSDFVKLGLKDDIHLRQRLEFRGHLNLLKAGILYCDEISTVSPQYAKEIQTKEFGCHLDSVLSSESDKIEGILNGVDYNIWNPETDKLIYQNYSPRDFTGGKAANKKKLQEEMHLPVDENIPVFSFIGRLSHQKGIDLMLKAFHRIKDENIQVVIQGIGERYFNERVKELTRKYPRHIAAVIEFNEHIAHQIYAGSDFFLMPSIFEPCGLSQLIALKYGTVPVVFKTGGLMDTIKPYSKDKETASGFMFSHYDASSFLEVIHKARDIFQQKNEFHQLVDNAFGADFSWDKSAEEYLNLYQSILDS